MKLSGVKEIFDNGEFVTIVMNKNLVIHLPSDGVHHMTLHGAESPASGAWEINHVTVDFYAE